MKLVLRCIMLFRRLSDDDCKFSKRCILHTRGWSTIPLRSHIFTKRTGRLFNTLALCSPTATPPSEWNSDGSFGVSFTKAFFAGFFAVHDKSITVQCIYRRRERITIFSLRKRDWSLTTKFTSISFSRNVTLMQLVCNCWPVFVSHNILDSL